MASFNKKLLIRLLISFIILTTNLNIIFSQDSTIDTLSLTPNNLNYGLDKQLNIYGFNLFFDYRINTNAGNFMLNQKYLGTAYSAGDIIIQDEENFALVYDYPISENFSVLSSSDFVLISNQGSSELNELSRLNFLGGIRIRQNEMFYLDLSAGRELNNQMGIESSGTIFKVNGLLKESEIDGYVFSGNIKGELLSLSLDRINRSLNLNSIIFKLFDENDFITANLSYKILDRFNAFRRDAGYMASNNLDFGYTLEARFNNMMVSDINLGFGLNDQLTGILKLYFSKNSIERFYNEYIPKDSKTGVRQYRNQLKVAINPEFNYKDKTISQSLAFLYSFESDENTVHNAHNVTQQEFDLLKSKAYELDNLTANFRLLSKTLINITLKDTFYLTGMSSITRFDTPSNDNNSDRDEFLGLISLGIGRRISENISLRIDGEAQFNHQVNLKASRSASNFWMRSIKLAPTVIFQTKSFYMRPQPYVLANYTVYDFEGFAPGVKSFSLRQIGYNDSLAYLIGNNLYLGTRIDLIYKETGTLFWSNFKESPVNGNLKFFYKFYTGYYDEKFNIAIGIRYFNLTQKNFRTSAFVNSDYKTESLSPEVIITTDFLNGTTLRLNGWYEFQTINDIYRNEIPNIILNTSIKL
jgi:hypothetical protein